MWSKIDKGFESEKGDLIFVNDKKQVIFLPCSGMRKVLYDGDDGRRKYSQTPFEFMRDYIDVER